GSGQGRRPRFRGRLRPGCPQGARWQGVRRVESRARRGAKGGRPIMSQGPTGVVHHDKSLLADSAAARLVMAIVDAQSSRGQADIVPTGGSMGSAVLVSLGHSPAKDAIDWRRLNVWWSDERFLPAGDPERNETQSRQALLDVVPLD